MSSTVHEQDSEAPRNVVKPLAATHNNYELMSFAPHCRKMQVAAVQPHTGAVTWCRRRPLLRCPCSWSRRLLHPQLGQIDPTAHRDPILRRLTMVTSMRELRWD